MNSPHKSILAYLFDHFPAADAILVFMLDHPLALSLIHISEPTRPY